MVAPPRWLGRAGTHRLGCVASTNDEALRLAQAGAPQGTVVIADQQRRGRGRLGRSWYSPPGANLYLSAVLRPHLAPRQVPPIALAAGLGVADAVGRAGVATTLKWPNDVLARGRKLAGILAEMSTQGHALDAVILGIGVNLNTGEFPPTLAERATSVRIESCRVVDREQFTATLLACLEPWLEAFFAGGVAAIAAAWTARCGHIGARVGVGSGSEAIQGTVLGLGGDGALEVRSERDGSVVAVRAGEIALVGSDSGGGGSCG